MRALLDTLLRKLLVDCCYKVAISLITPPVICTRIERFEEKVLQASASSQFGEIVNDLDMMRIPSTTTVISARYRTRSFLDKKPIAAPPLTRTPYSARQISAIDAFQSIV